VGKTALLRKEVATYPLLLQNCN